MSKIELQVASMPHNDRCVVELSTGTEIWAEVAFQDDEASLVLFPSSTTRVLNLDQMQSALARAKELLYG